MPEIKNQFTGGKMNKDVDERLVPKGEYRDAMNIQVSTSEGSDVGTIQNILGNEQIEWKCEGDQVRLLDGTVCVGTISDEKNDSLYWFVSNYSENEVIDISFKGYSFFKDMILLYDPTATKGGSILPVFVDIHSTTVAIHSLNVPTTGQITLVGNYSDLQSLIQPGDTISNFMIAATNAFPFFEATVISVTNNPPYTNINIGDYTEAPFATYQMSGSGEVTFQINADKKVLNFNKNRLITNINIVDEMLFWTDGVTEPKKINIPLSIEGTEPCTNDHTRLINPKQGIAVNDDILVREEHITVIRKAPKLPLTVTTEMGNVTAFGQTASITWLLDPAEPVLGNIPIGGTTSIAVLLFFDPSSFDQWPLNLGDIINFNPSAGTSGASALFESEVAAEISEIVNDGTTDIISPSGAVVAAAGTWITVHLTVIRIASTVSSTDLNYTWALQGFSGEAFKNKLLRFSHRYKYTDGEYSTFAPFTNVVFEPSNFDYHVKEAFNKGMENQITRIILSNYQANIPEDVVSIDLLYKESNSPAVYTIDTISNNNLTNNNSSYEVRAPHIKAMLPEDQLLRAWDNVPRTAKTQEITGSRVVYGNYLQNYDIIQNPIISVDLANRFDCDQSLSDNVFQVYPSIKSIRNYSLGVSFLDKYGRQSPVFTHKNASFEMPISSSASVSQLRSTLSGPIPSWSTHFKYFIKETANEYYNLSMDRVYDARDGNIWLAFPSSDRNKVDEETFLILKKGVEGSAPITESNKYKILAIENEAPDYIKTEQFLVAQDAEDGSGVFTLFTNINNYPILDEQEVIIKKSNWDSTNIPLSDFEKMCVKFTRVIGGVTQTTDIYEITNFHEDTANDEYSIALSKKIEETWLSDPAIPTQPDPTVGIIVYKKIVENRAEFDGRFFAKVTRDIIIDTYIVQAATLSILNNPKVKRVLPFYYLADSSGPSGDNTTNAVHGTGISDTEAEWKSLFDPEGTGIEAIWFIDSAHYVGFFEDDDVLQNCGIIGCNNFHFDRHNGPSDPPTKKTPGYKQGIYQEGSQTYIDLSYGYVKSAPNSAATAAQHFAMHTDSSDLSRLQAVADAAKGNGCGDTPWIQHEDCDGGVYFQACGDKTGASHDNWKSENDLIAHWKVGSQSLNPNNYTANNQDIVSRLNPGQIFKFGGDPSNTAYVIDGAVEVTYSFNYKNMAGFYQEQHEMFDACWSSAYYDGSFDPVMGPTAFGSPVSSTIAGCGFTARLQKVFDELNFVTRAQNKRVTWKIPISVYKNFTGLPDNPTASGSPFNPINSVNGASATDIGTIEFIDLEWYGVTDQIIPEDPAVWETEPKQDIDLDIYYEIDGTFPRFINNDNNYIFAPVGSTVSVVFPQNPGTPQPKVSSWNDNIVYFDIPLQTTTSTANVVTSLYSELTFTRPDGSCVKTYITQWINNFIQNGMNSTFQVRVARSVTNNPITLSWFNCYSFENGVESYRVRDDFNQLKMDKGAKASSTLDMPYQEEQRKYGLIYSGLYNSTAGINNLNQFNSSSKITKDINPIYGSIQKLYSRSTADGDLVTLCEDRILKILANKDAVFNADGNPNLTATENVLGQAMPYSGEYGISKNPESFAAESYRAYFTDQVRGMVMRLSQDGLTPISDHGMKDWFRDNLKLGGNLIGSYDDKKDEYNLTLTNNKINKTVTFREDVKGWVSFKSFVAESAISCANNYYTFKDGRIWLHHVEDVNRNTFYNVYKDSSFEVVLNEVPGSIKSFTTLNYEGTQSRVVKLKDPTTGGTVDDGEYYNLQPKNGWYVQSIIADEGKSTEQKGSLSEFLEKEGKWFNYIRGENLNIDVNYIALNYDGNNFAHQGLGRLVGFPTDITVYGCMDASMFNYNPAATVNGISILDNEDVLPNTFTDPCVPYIYGCMDPDAANYNGPSTNTDDGSCLYPGCFDNTTVNGCGLGCTGAINHLDTANADCTATLFTNGGTDTSCCNYCVYGCIDSTAFNYNPTATCDDGSCIAYVYGCTDNFNSNVINYDNTANTDDGSCDYNGCTDPNAYNYLLPISGSSPDIYYTNPITGESSVCWTNQSVTTADNVIPFSISLDPPPFPGPTISYLDNINSNPTIAGTLAFIPPCATVDDGSCLYDGCPDASAINYDPIANITSNDSCLYCGDTDAVNFDGAEAFENDGVTPTSTDNCEYCENLLPTVTLDNATETSFDITWTHPTNNISPNTAGQVNTGDNGLYLITISWGQTANIPPYNGSTGGGMFQYNPALLANGTETLAADYPAITDNGDGTYTITIDDTQAANGINTATITSSTSYTAAIDTYCINNITGTTLFTQNITTNFNTGVNITTLTPPPPPVLGCFNDPTAINFMCPAGQGQSNSQVPCIGVANGGIDPGNGLIVNTDDGSCIAVIPGCIDGGNCSTNPTGTEVFCYDSSYNAFNSAIPGTAADNYNSSANNDDGSCVFTGCTNSDDQFFDDGYNTPCVDVNGVQNGDANSSCCAGCRSQSMINWNGVTGYNQAHAANCIACPTPPVIPSNDAAAGLGLNLTYVGNPVFDPVTNEEYMSVHVEISFPTGFDFDAINCFQSLGVKTISLNFEDQTNGLHQAHLLMVPCSYNTTGASYTHTIPAFPAPFPGGGMVPNTRIIHNHDYKVTFNTVCARDFDGVDVYGPPGNIPTSIDWVDLDSFN